MGRPRYELTEDPGNWEADFAQIQIESEPSVIVWGRDPCLVQRRWFAVVKPGAVSAAMRRCCSALGWEIR